MPKLSDDVARDAEVAAEDNDGRRELIPEGVYVGRLFEVSVSDNAGPSGYHYWAWKFKLEDDGYKNREQWLITSLSPDSQFAIGGAFKAFGVPANTHTDELLGERALLKVSVSVAQKGSRAGEKVNRTDYIMPYTEEKASTPLDADF